MYLHPPILIIKPHNIILTHILTQLHLNNLQYIRPGIKQSVFHTRTNKSTFTLTQTPLLFIHLHASLTFNHHPVFTPMNMKLQTQSFTRHYLDILNLVVARSLKYSIRTPRPVYGITTLFQAGHQIILHQNLDL